MMNTVISKVRKLKTFLSALALLLLSIPCAAQSKVNVSVAINTAAKSFACTYTIILKDTAPTGKALFNLDRHFTVHRVKGKSIGAYTIRPYYDTFTKDTLQQVAIRFSPGKYTDRKVSITYSSHVPEHACKSGVIELSAHTNWLPNIPDKEYEPVNYTLEVQVDKDYEVVSTRPPVKHKADKYKFKGYAPNIEITAIAAKRFYTLGSPTVTLSKAGTPPTKADTALLSETESIIAYYNQTIGQQAPIQCFTILLSQTNRDAFGLLDNAMVVTYTDFNVANLEDKLILAHEISHKWWAYGFWKSYENWLNEAFSTYTSLLYLKYTGNTAAFHEAIAKRRVSSANTPPLLGFAPSQYDYQTFRKVLYDKGAVILFELHSKVGDTTFYGILTKAAASKIATTKDFLNLVEQETDARTKSWLLQLLKA